MKENNPVFATHDTSIKGGLLAGFVASAVSSVVLVTLTAFIAIPEFNYIAIQGSIFGLAKTALSSWLLCFAIGTFVWGLLYALIEPYFGSNKNWFFKGFIFGLLVWIFVMVALMPLAGVGLFLKKFAVGAAMIVLITDLLFGLVLAYFYEKITRS